MAMVTDKPEDLPSSNDLDNVVDPDEEGEGDRAEIYLSGAHVATLDRAPGGLGRVTLMAELEVVEESTRFTEDGDHIAIRRCRRVGDMWLPGTERPPSKDELKALSDAVKAKEQAEKLANEDAERDELERNEPPMFDEDGDPIEHDPAPSDPPPVNEDQGANVAPLFSESRPQ